MYTFNELINAATAEMERSTAANTVGNKPHFPMVFFCNRSLDCESFHLIYSKLAKIWPQTAHRLAYYRYDLNASTLTRAVDETVISTDDIFKDLDTIRTYRNTFNDMRSFCLYNVIDTSSIEDVDEFINDYRMIKKIQEWTDNPSKSMVIVLLNDSSRNRKLSADIRYYLDDANDYDSTIVISNRCRNNESYTRSELLKVIADILILSDNDAVTAADDENYISRIQCLYEKQKLTVSFMSRGRPCRKIILQMINCCLQQIGKLLKSDYKEEESIPFWQKKLGIDDNKIIEFEKLISQLYTQQQDDRLLYIPMKIIPDIRQINFDKEKFSDFKQITFPKIMSKYFDDYLESDILPKLQSGLCIEMYENTIRSSVTSAQLAAMPEDMPERLFEHLTTGETNEKLPVNEYVQNVIKNKIRYDILYPDAKKCIENLRNKAEDSIINILKLLDDFNVEYPVNGFDDIGNMFEIITLNYLRTDQGMEKLNRLLSIGLTKLQMLEFLFDILRSVIHTYRDEFSLSFVDLWSKLLDMAGNMIYRQISVALTENTDDRTLLWGSYAYEKKMQIFMLHTTDANGNNPTGLFGYLQQTFKDVNDIQYFNTGSDDDLEVITFVSLDNNRLKF